MLTNNLTFDPYLLKVDNKRLRTMRKHLIYLQRRLQELNNGNSSEEERTVARTKDMVTLILAERDALE